MVISVKVEVPPIKIDFPALQAYVDLLAGQQKQELDALTAKLGAATSINKGTEEELQSTVDKATQH